MPTRSSTSTYRDPDAVRDPVARTLGVMRNSTAGAAHQFELRTKSSALTLMHAMRSAGSIDRGHRFLADLKHALRPEAPKLSTDLIRRAQEADLAEELSECRFLTEPTPANAQVWRLDIERAIAVAEEQAAALRSYEEAAQ